MKQWIITAALTASPIYALATCPDSHKTAESTPIVQKKGVTNITLSGMSCSRCVKNVTQLLEDIKKAEGVNIEVSLNNIAIDHSKVKLSKTELNNIQSEIEQLLSKTKYKVIKGSS